MRDNVSVSVEQMGLAREQRVEKRNRLLGLIRKGEGKTLINLSVNTPGPVKVNGLYRRLFLVAEKELTSALKPLYSEKSMDVTGEEGFYISDQIPQAVKKIAVAIEENHPIGRLFDIDVFDEKGGKLSRGYFRKCIVCGEQVQICARSRKHSIDELTEKIKLMAESYFRKQDALYISELSRDALFYELDVTPKPGLVDRNNSGSHKDMDYSLMKKSAGYLEQYFFRCAMAADYGTDINTLAEKLRCIGIEAEKGMLGLTGGINTHKGAIYSLGILSAAYMLSDEGETEQILDIASKIGKVFLSEETLKEGSFGSEYYLKNGHGGIRQEVAAGFPMAKNYGLPSFSKAMEIHSDENVAGVAVLLELLQHTEDTNIIKRAGEDMAQNIRQDLQKNVPSYSDKDEILEYALKLDEKFIEMNVSPGGCADLLAVTWFLSKAEESGDKQFIPSEYQFSVSM